MNIVKLPWAGIKVEYENISIVIDPFYHFPSALGTPSGKLYPLDEFGDTDAVLLTHVHPDHFDPEAIKQYYGADIPIYVPVESLKDVEGHGFTSVVGVQIEQIISLKAFTLIPTFFGRRSRRSANRKPRDAKRRRKPIDGEMARDQGRVDDMIR